MNFNPDVYFHTQLTTQLTAGGVREHIRHPKRAPMHVDRWFSSCTANQNRGSTIRTIGAPRRNSATLPSWSSQTSLVCFRCSRYTRHGCGALSLLCSAAFASSVFPACMKDSQEATRNPVNSRTLSERLEAPDPYYDRIMNSATHARRT